MHRLLISLAPGWVLGTWVGLQQAPSAVVVVIGVIASIACCWRVGVYAVAVGWLVCGVCAGWVLADAARGAQERVQLRVAEEAVVLLRVAEGPRPARRDGAWIAELEAVALHAGAGHRGPGTWTEMAGRVRVSGWAPVRMPVRGDRVVARAAVRRTQAPAHRFDFDAAAMDARRGLSGRLELVGEPVWVTPAPTWNRGVDVARIRLERAVLAHVDDREAGVLLALLTGSRGALHPEDRRRFADSGAAHVLAVSGLHLGLLTLLVFRGLEWALRVTLARGRPPSSRQLAAGATLPFVLVYVVFTGAPASACRAGIMAACLLVSELAERRAASVPALSLAVVVLLAWQPLWLLDLGFQLSVAATASLVVTARLPMGVERTTRLDRAIGALVESVRVSTVATLATAPSLLWFTGRVPWVSPLANLVVVPPLALVALPVGVLGAAGVSLGVPGAPALLEIAELAVRIALGLAELYEPVFAQQLVWGRPVGVALWGWCALACVSPWLGRASTRRQFLVVCVVSLVLWCGRPAAWRDLPDGAVHRIPMRSGEVVWLQLPGPRHVVWGAGPRGYRGSTPAQRQVLPYLWGHGVARVDALVLPASSARLCGGAEALIAALRPPVVIAPEGCIVRGGQAVAGGTGARWVRHADVTLQSRATRVDVRGGEQPILAARARTRSVLVTASGPSWTPRIQIVVPQGIGR